MGMLQEFKDFAVKGNVIDLAVGLIIGDAFGKIVAVLVERVIMPPIGFLIGGVDFSQLKVILQAAAPDGKGEVSIGYGEFLQSSFNFLIVTIAIFVVVKTINSQKKQKPAASAPPAPIPEDVILLREIRDLLKKS